MSSIVATVFTAIATMLVALPPLLDGAADPFGTDVAGPNGNAVAQGDVDPLPDVGAGDGAVPAPEFPPVLPDVPPTPEVPDGVPTPDSDPEPEPEGSPASPPPPAGGPAATTPPPTPVPPSPAPPVAQAGEHDAISGASPVGAPGAEDAPDDAAPPPSGLDDADGGEPFIGFAAIGLLAVFTLVLAVVATPWARRKIFHKRVASEVPRVGPEEDQGGPVTPRHGRPPDGP